MMTAAKNNPLPPQVPSAIGLLISVLLIGTALVGLLLGEFRINALGSTTAIRRSEQPVGYWALFLVLATGGFAGVAVVAPPLCGLP